MCVELNRGSICFVDCVKAEMVQIKHKICSLNDDPKFVFYAAILVLFV